MWVQLGGILPPFFVYIAPFFDLPIVLLLSYLRTFIVSLGVVSS